jgi:hypothetical protein
MKLKQVALPSPEEIARHMGLCDLRVGRHVLRNEAGEQAACVTVSSLWYAEVVPSFHPRIALAVASAVGETFRDRRCPDWVKAVMATPEAVHAIPLDADPLRAPLNALEVFCTDSSPASRNGIAYTVTFQTLHLQGSLQFGNPNHRCLRSLEDALLSLAQQVAAQSGLGPFVEVVDAWREYVRDHQA